MCVSNPGARHLSNELKGLKVSREPMPRITWVETYRWPLRFSSDPPPLPTINGFSFLRMHHVEIIRPGERLLLPRKVAFWVPRWGWDKTAKELCDEAESYEDYRIRQAEEVVLGIRYDAEFDKIDTERRQRGMALALDPRIKRIRSGVWAVPAQAPSPRRRSRWTCSRMNSSGKLVREYEVDTHARTCTCPDFARRRKMCKHIYAAEYLQAQASVRDLADATAIAKAIATAKAKSFSWQATWLSRNSNFALLYGDLNNSKLAAVRSTVQSGRFSTKHPNLSAPPRSEPQPAMLIHKDALRNAMKGVKVTPSVHGPRLDADYAQLEMQMLASLRVDIQPITGPIKAAKVTPFIHDTKIVELAVEVEAPTPAAHVVIPIDYSEL
jgi:SWIM zinc finger